MEEFELALLWKQLPKEEDAPHVTREKEVRPQPFLDRLQPQPEVRRARILALTARVSLPEEA